MRIQNIKKEGYRRSFDIPVPKFISWRTFFFFSTGNGAFCVLAKLTLPSLGHNPAQGSL